MSKKKLYHYNPDTVSFEEMNISFREKSKRFFLRVFTSAFLGFVFFLTFEYFIDSPNERQLKSDNKELEFQYKILNNKIDDLIAVLNNLQQRDNNLYRVIFQADSIPAQRYIASDIDNKAYKNIADNNTAKIISDTEDKIALASRKIYVQSKSYDELAELIKTHESKLQHVPAIQPILNKDLKRVASGFGYRIDPIYHTRRMHSGMDFSAPIGTDIYATGDGVVTFAGWKQGYGKTVVIDHGFDYQTLYGHMHDIKVRQNQKVSRAEVIGYVGNSGKSTGPHLHYEVLFKDKRVDPLNYYFLDLSPEEYDAMIHLAQNAGQTMD